MSAILEFKKVGYSYNTSANHSKQSKTRSIQHVDSALYSNSKNLSQNAAMSWHADQLGVVHDLSFSFKKGDFVAIIGGNGAGKTTTSKLMNGLLKPTVGEVFLDGVATSETKTSKIANKVGMLFQDPDKQICKNTVHEELAFGLRLRGLSDEDISQRVDVIINEFGLLPSAAPFMLSRGERQILALASIIVCEPEVLILDEPTAGLDYRECMQIMQRVKRLNELGTTVIMICHDMELVLDFAKRLLVMARGEIIADGAPQELFRNTNVMEEASLLPPMIIDLSLKLKEDFGVSKLLDSVSSVEEMLKALQAVSSTKTKEG